MNSIACKIIVRALCSILLVSGGLGYVAGQQQRVSQNNQPAFVRSVDVHDFTGNEWQQSDRNQDGSVDYVVLFNAEGLKVQEVYDVSHDGNFDDFYFYDDGELIMRELDTTHDGKIDVWVSLTRGYLITEIKRDTNGDGDPDYIKQYE